MASKSDGTRTLLDVAKAYSMLPCRMAFELESNYKPRGTKQAIAKLLKSIEAGIAIQTLLGVTGSARLSPCERHCELDGRR